MAGLPPGHLVFSVTPSVLHLQVKEINRSNLQSLPDFPADACCIGSFTEKLKIKQHAKISCGGISIHGRHLQLSFDDSM